ncbi:hypothetical protein D915_010232 [Fasciola hepatica]|uniref:Uncharacterized protein n=1 Tax=Fasciola hepatica TaxID=6192 RepID=A0A4E0QW49_FASHE|nr:hypothetical protein D915_010232 [Fasciola hepatica]
MNTRKQITNETKEVEEIVWPLSSAVAGFCQGLAATGRIDENTARNMNNITKSVATFCTGSSRIRDREVAANASIALGVSALAGVLVGWLTEPIEEEQAKDKIK